MKISRKKEGREQKAEVDDEETESKKEGGEGDEEEKRAGKGIEQKKGEM